MSRGPRFTISINIESTNEERIAAFLLYQRAFHAKKLSESTPPNGSDVHIMMEIYGTGILLGPGHAEGQGLDAPITCEVRFDDEGDFKRAYQVLCEEARSYSLEGPYPWAALLALVTDKFGVGWALYYNEE